MPEKRKDSNGRILKTGESQRPNGSYMYRYKDISGKPRWSYAPTLKELRAQEEAIQRDLLQGIRATSGDMTVSDLVDNYLRQYGSTKINTGKNQAFMRSVVRKDAFGSMAIKDVKPSDARLFIIHLRDDLHYAGGTLSNLFGFLRRAFNVAIEDDLVRKNPFSFNPGVIVTDDATPREALTDEQRDTLLTFVQSRQASRKWYNQIVILLETGMRISEMCGLTFNDVDFGKRDLHINKQLQTDGSGQRHIRPPKSKSGFRTVPLTDKALAAFRDELKHRPKPEREPEVDGCSGFIFLNANKQPRVSGELETAMRSIIKRYNATHAEPLPHIKPHVLRHTFITGLYRAGLDLKTIQLIAGHSDPRTTSDVYIHMQYDQAKEAFLRARAQL